MESIYKERAQKVAFIRGEAPVEFALVARAIDVLGNLCRLVESRTGTTALIVME